MPAENALCPTGCGVSNRAIGNLGRQPLPSRIQPIEQPRNKHSFGAAFLDEEIQRTCQSVHEQMILNDKIVELMSMNGDTLLACTFPCEFLIHTYSDEVRHYLTQAVIMVSLHPNHFHIPLRI